MKRTVYVYDWREPNDYRPVLAYLTPQHVGPAPERLCVHEVDAESGIKAKQQAARDHKSNCQPAPASREGIEHRKHPSGDYCIHCRAQWPCDTFAGLCE